MARLAAVTLLPAAVAAGGSANGDRLQFVCGAGALDRLDHLQRRLRRRQGKVAGTAFLHEGEAAFDGDFELPLPITAAGPRLDPDPRLASGTWAWRRSLAGRVLAEKRFRAG